MIAFVHGLRNWGSVEEYVAALVRALRERGDEVALIYPDDRALAPFGEIGGEAYDLDAGGLTVRLARRLRALRPRIVHVTDVFPQALVAARLARAPHVLVTHHTPELPRRDNPAGRFWNRIGWAMRPDVIYTSESDRERDDRPRSHVIQLGIDLERFTRGRRALEGRLVGNVARLAEQKGQATLLEAAPLVLERHPDVRFVIVGDGELRDELRRRAAPLGDRVLFTGARDDVPDLLASFEVFAFPSLFEGLCLAVIEAQAAGVPVVATPVGGIVENVIDGESGLLVPPHDARALAAGIVRLLDDPARASVLAERARTRVLRRYSRQRMVERTLVLYDSMR